MHLSIKKIANYYCFSDNITRYIDFILIRTKTRLFIVFPLVAVAHRIEQANYASLHGPLHPCHRLLDHENLLVPPYTVVEQYLLSIKQSRQTCHMDCHSVRAEEKKIRTSYPIASSCCTRATPTELLLATVNRETAIGDKMMVSD